MKKALLLFLLLFSFVSQAQELTPPPLGCQVYTSFDPENDGFTQFDLPLYFIQFRSDMLNLGFDLSGYAFEFYPSMMDYDSGTNAITAQLYTNIVSYEQYCFIKFIHSGTGPIYDPNELDYPFACHKLVTTGALATMSQTENPFALYPNPASGLLFIKPDRETAISTTIYDLNGRNVLNATTATIDLSVLNNGIYLVKVTMNGKQYSQKLTVAH